MNEIELEKWSETLMDLRQERFTRAQTDMESKGSTYTPSEFFDQSTSNLDKILEKWVNLEQSDWDANTPDDPATAIQAIRSETDSLVDLEVEAILRDGQVLKQDGNWENDAFVSGQAAFEGAVTELRNKYQLKLGAFSGAQKKKSTPIFPAPLTTSAPPQAPQMRYSGGSSGGSGSGILLMFVVGLVLGAAPSLYFWDANNKMENRFQAEKSRIEGLQKVIEDNYAMLREVFGQMAAGKMKSLSDMESELRKIKSESGARRKRMEQEFLEERERITKKLASGNRLDQALEDLEYRKVQRLGAARDQENLDTEKLEKQIKIVKDLLAG